MGGNDTLLLQFPAGTGVPNGSLSGILLNGISATANGSNSASAVTITVPNDLAASSAVSITIPASAGVTNPANTTFYNMTVNTTRETTGVLSAPYAIGAITSV